MEKIIENLRKTMKKFSVKRVPPVKQKNRFCVIFSDFFINISRKKVEKSNTRKRKYL